MAKHEPYKITEDNRIVPVYIRDWVKNQPETNDFTSALQMLLTIGIRDAGLSDNDNILRENLLRDIPEIYAAHYIDAEEALFILTGIKPNYAAYQFQWEGMIYFTMRPDFGLLSIMSNFDEEPLNCFESKIQDKLFRWYIEIEAISRAIKHVEILEDDETEAPFEEWTHLFQKRGFDLSHIPQKFLRDPLSVLRKENSALKASLEKTEKKLHELSEKLQKHEKRLSFDDEADSRSKRTYLNIIGALLECVTGTFKDESFPSQAKLQEFMVEKFDDLHGISSRTLTDKFALANKALKGELD